MLIRTVKDLKSYLAEAKVSPEEFAPRVQLSHMTIRRLLRESDKKEVPAKYHANFDAVTEPRVAENPAGNYLPGDAQDFSTLLTELEAKGKSVKDVKVVGEDLKKKLRLSQVGQGLRTRLETLFSAVKSKGTKPKFRLLALGAILYFVDPLDIVPDVLPAIGFIDDFSVISLVLGLMVTSKK